MTQADQAIPLTYLKTWYNAQPNKTLVLDQVRYKLDRTVSTNTIINWMNGRSDPKKENQLDALEAVTGINRKKLFQYVK